MQPHEKIDVYKSWLRRTIKAHTRSLTLWRIDWCKATKAQHWKESARIQKKIDELLHRILAFEECLKYMQKWNKKKPKPSKEI